MQFERKTLGHKEFKEKLDTKQEECMLIDVRSMDEHHSGTIPGATCIPVDNLEQSLAQLPKDKQLLLFCRSGKRSSKACDILHKHGYDKISDLEGGISTWLEQGLPTIKRRNAIPIQRQVMIAAGLLISSGMFLGHFINYGFYLIPFFIGFGLLFAGISGFCGMAILLEKMPWNKVC
jgi:rhodanese-related sulfurtransferase